MSDYGNPPQDPQRPAQPVRPAEPVRPAARPLRPAAPTRTASSRRYGQQPPTASRGTAPPAPDYANWFKRVGAYLDRRAA